VNAGSLNKKNFARLRSLVQSKSGINLHEGKMELVRSRLCNRLRAVGAETFDDYCDYLAIRDDGSELRAMLNAISTNKTSFFREKSHFDFLEREVYSRFSDPGRAVHLRFWSAGCSSGEEPYSLAIHILENFRGRRRRFARVFATDISTAVLEEAKAGVYPASRIADFPVIKQRRYFKRGVGNNEGLYLVKDQVRRMVTFRHQNLMEDWEITQLFDAIFCCNVMIYFDKKTQEKLVGRFHASLKPGGHLFIGHSESLAPIRHAFTYVQPSIYRK